MTEILEFVIISSFIHHETGICVNFVDIFVYSLISMDRWFHRNWQAPLISLDSLQLKFLVAINRMYKNLWECPWWIWFINYTHCSNYFSSLGALHFFFSCEKIYRINYHDMVSSLQVKNSTIISCKLQIQSLALLTEIQYWTQQATEGTHKQCCLACTGFDLMPHKNVPGGIEISMCVCVCM